MLRIMDVASALRRERETAEAVLDVASAKTKLRERLLATAAAAGEPVTAAEVDAAIEQYFRQQHEYQDPKAGWGTFWARAWVMRRGLFAAGSVLAVAMVGIFVVLQVTTNSFATPKPLPKVVSGSAPAPRQIPEPAPSPAVDEWPQAWEQFQRDTAAAQGLAADAEAKLQVQKVLDRATAMQAAKSLSQLRKAAAELATLVVRLEEEYTVTIVSRPGEKSGVDRFDNRGRVSGYYLIVEAVTPDGRILPRRIQNAENQSTTTVTKWGELVSEAVWNRVVADKQADGIIDNARFAQKERGAYTEKMVMQDGGQPLQRGRQITQW